MILIVFLFLLTLILNLNCLTYLIIVFSFFNTEFMSFMIILQRVETLSISERL